MRTILRRFLLCLLPWLAVQTGAMAQSLPEPMADTVTRFIRDQTRGLPGQVAVVLGRLAPETQLPPCNTFEAYLPSGSRLWGKTHVGIQCLGPAPWKILLPVTISVTASYIVTARPLVAGHLVQAADLQSTRGDLTGLPTGVVTESAAAIGKRLKHSLAGGQPLRGDQLLAPLVIRQGQSVRVMTQGNGFSVSAEGKAINNAAVGELVQVRMPSGQIVSGPANADGNIEIFY